MSIFTEIAKPLWKMRCIGLYTLLYDSLIEMNCRFASIDTYYINLVNPLTA